MVLICGVTLQQKKQSTIYKSVPERSASKAYQKLLNEIFASTSEPPRGNSDEIIEFINIKLSKLAFNGQIEYLIKIISQLPDSQKWEKWKKWYVIYLFLNKEDKKACKKKFQIL